MPIVITQTPGGRDLSTVAALLGVTKQSVGGTVNHQRVTPEGQMAARKRAAMIKDLRAGKPAPALPDWEQHLINHGHSLTIVANKLGTQHPQLRARMEADPAATAAQIRDITGVDVLAPLVPCEHVVELVIPLTLTVRVKAVSPARAADAALFSGPTRLVIDPDTGTITITGATIAATTGAWTVAAVGEADTP